MASVVDICNLAITRLGHQMITSLDENSKAAQLCTLHYPIVRDSLLRAHPWNFAIRRATLAQSTTTPNHEYGYQHALPTDCLKVIRTEWEADGTTPANALYTFPGIVGTWSQIIPYRIESGFLLSDETDVKIEYISQVTDTAQFDESFVDVLAQRLAAEIGIALTDNQVATKTMWDIYSAKLTEARLNDAQEGTPRDIVDVSPWLVARC